MSVSLRIATFNLENFDEDPEKPEEIAVRISAIRPQLQRLKADVLCLQEVNSQKGQNGKPELKALKSLIKGTAYENFHLAVTRTKSGSYFAERNLVILSRFPLISQECIKMWS